MATLPTELFQEDLYFVHNPEAKQAMLDGYIPSGWMHYIHFGHDQNRLGVPEVFKNFVSKVKNTVAAVPPDHLIKRVHGPNIETFDKIGKIVTLDIYRAIAPYLSLEDPLDILDFGCGCARVTRYMRTVFPNAAIKGCDIDPEAIDWCKASCPGFEFSVNGDVPPLPYKADSFDFLYAISVFTHLPEDLQLLWLAELKRVTRKNGYLVLTFAGDRLIRPKLSKEQNEAFDVVGIYYQTHGTTDGLPDYYKATWHTADYIKRIWSIYFDIIAIMPRGINSHQDLVLCRPKK